MSLSLLEQETVIVYNRAEPTATVNTYEPSIIRKLDELAKNDGRVSIVQRGKGWCVYKIPKKMVRIVKPGSVSEEKRAELIARGKALAEKYKGGKNENVDT